MELILLAMVLKEKKKKSFLMRKTFDGLIYLDNIFPSPKSPKILITRLKIFWYSVLSGIKSLFIVFQLLTLKISVSGECFSFIL